MSSAFSKVLTRPTSRRSKWFAPKVSSWDLVRLGWGSRFYGDYPVRTKKMGHWLYCVILKGSPILHMGKEHVPMQSGEIILLPAQCSHGWKDLPGKKCEVLIWIWKDRSPIKECVPPSNGYLKWRMDPFSLLQVKHLHSYFRNEVSSPDHWTHETLNNFRRVLDVFLCRSFENYRKKLDPLDRVDLSVLWMHQNIEGRRPIASLCDYLQLPPHILENLFLKKLGERPLNYFQKIKMERAQVLLKEGKMLIKEVAYSLGYHHPNDFSRAYKKYTGKTPKRGFK